MKIRMVFTLLSVPWCQFRNVLLRSTAAERRRALRNLFSTALIVIMIGTLAYGFLDPFVQLSHENSSLRFSLSRLPTLAFFSAFWMLLLSAVTIGIQIFYMSQELPLLLSAPVSPRTVFYAKFVEATAANASLFLTIGAPVLLAYSFARGYITPPYIIYLVLVLVASSALPTGLGILFSFLLMRLLPPSRVRDLLAAIGIAAFATIYFTLSISMRRWGEMSIVQQGAGRLAALLDAPIFRAGPWAWAGEVLSGDFAGMESWQRIGLLWFVAAVSIGITACVAQWAHWRGWAAVQESPIVATGSLPPVGEGWERRLRWVPGPMRAVFLKDLRSLRRDMRQLSMLFIPIAVVAVFLFNVTQEQSVHPIPPLVFVLILFLILAPISLRLATSGFVTENRAMWVMMTAPNDPSTVLAGKFLYAYVLSLPLALVATLLYGMMAEMTRGELWMSLGLLGCAVAGFCGIGVGTGAYFSDFTTDNPRLTVSAAGRLVIFCIQIGYLMLLAAITILAWIFQHYAPAAVGLMAAALVVLMSAAFVLFPLGLGARRLRSLEW
jgi:ABC-2 type transport system permease protein